MNHHRGQTHTEDWSETSIIKADLKDGFTQTLPSFFCSFHTEHTYIHTEDWSKTAMKQVH